LTASTFSGKSHYESVQALQSDMDDWLHQYNDERLHRGYRNMGRRPFETIEAGKLEREKLMEKAA
jgi:hypothetical protein